MVLGDKLFKKMILEWLSEKSRSCEGFKKLIYTTQQSLEQNFKGIFLTCFSTTKEKYVLDNGLLSQWRGYGSYAIKFRKDVLLEALKKESSFHALDENVRYYSESDSDYKNFKSEPSLKFDEFVKFISTDEWMEIEKKTSLTSKDEDKIVKAIELILHPRFFVKHKGFHEERERRIVSLIPRDSSKKLHFHAPCKCHIKLFEDDSTIIEKAAKEIIIGPVSDQKAAKNWVENMLREFGYRDDIKVKCSEIPFIKS
jgi:hypothetical protein